MGIHNLVSLAGVFGLMAVAWVFSANRRRMNWRVILLGVALQLAVGVLVFRAPGSRQVFLWLNDAVYKTLDAAQEGQRFVFGRLALGPGETDASGQTSAAGFVLAFKALPSIIFFSAAMCVLYYWGIMPWIIRQFARVFTRLMRVSGAESLCAASNIFVGIESATTIRPYIEKMTRSELCVVLTAGMATIASSVMGLYVFMLCATFPTIAGHLISASVLSAPAAIVMSKILVPEDGKPLTLGVTPDLAFERPANAVEAVVDGAMTGLKLVMGVVALLVAFLGILAVLNLILAQAGRVCGASTPWTVQAVLGWAGYPFALLMGVPPRDAAAVGELIGARAVLTEVWSYGKLAELAAKGALSERSVVVTAYALCGFAHVASMAIFVGGVSALAPSRRKDISALALRALLAATLACFMTGAVAGALYRPGDAPLIRSPKTGAAPADPREPIYPACLTCPTGQTPPGDPPCPASLRCPKNAA
ncbi:MAG TPA: nucleoside transporter C-terminal domain-containing protein [Candidatus Brocadiia bacterium]|nr:nucleoside transporter C-terminal domain-containing protein [Candidatus Brocadiia bacterium]